MATKPKRGSPAPAGKNRGGRPFLPDADRRDTLVRVLTTSSEYEELQGAAAFVGIPMSTWMLVLTKPGATLITRMLFAASPFCNEALNERTAALLAL